MAYAINIKSDTGLVDRSENTNRFYHDIKKYDVLSREEEIRLFHTLRHGNDKEKKKARDKIINCNQRLVISCAKCYATTDTLTDYINEANFGLMRAIDKYDHTTTTKFSTFAVWDILYAINLYRYGTQQLVKRPNYSKTFHVISKAKNYFLQQNERLPSDDELLELVRDKYHKKVNDKNDLLDTKFASIDTASDDDEVVSAEINEYNKSSVSYNDCEVQENNEFNKKLVESLLDILKPREKEIIKLRFGLAEDDGIVREYRPNEIAEKVGLTSERVRQLEADAMKKLKNEYAKRISFS